MSEPQQSNHPVMDLCGSWPLGWSQGEPISCVRQRGHGDWCQSHLGGQWQRSTERTPSSHDQSCQNDHIVVTDASSPRPMADIAGVEPTLAEWLSAQLDEDGQVALVATSCSEDGLYDAREWRVADREIVGDDGSDDPLDIARARNEDPGLLDHIARWDPARVLAEVEAKRFLVEQLEIELDDSELAASAVRTLRLLALPYADRAGYREEWKP